MLEFDAGANGNNNYDQRMSVLVQGASTLISDSVTVFAPGGGGSQWVAQTYAFVADNAFTTVAFQDISTVTSGVDLLLDHVQLTAQNSPVITSQPSSVNAQLGAQAAFSATALGQSPLSYQWLFNGTNITGASGTSYTIGSVQAGNAGTYNVVVSNGSGSVTSAPAILTVGGSHPFINGSFESDYEGWTASGNLGVAQGGSYPPTDGVKLLIFNAGEATPNGIISQAFATIPGQVYTLAFDVGVIAFNNSEVELQATIQGASMHVSQAVPLFGIGNGVTIWQEESDIFVADSTTTTLIFQDISPGTASGLDLLLDNVRVYGQETRSLTFASSNPPNGVSLSVSPADTNGFDRRRYAVQSDLL